MFDTPFNNDSADLSSTSPAAPRPLTVTELTHRIKRVLETQIADVLVEGEISGCKYAASGHIYLDLKDSGSIIKAVVWAADAARIKLALSDGMKVEARGRIAVYEQRGQYQLRILNIRPAGLGKLYQAFIELKEKLSQEGLFDPDIKVPLPAHPRTIGLVTSPTGAAIQDMLNILSRRAPHIDVLIYPVRVQGEGAGAEIARAIDALNQMATPVDIMIVGRGGGSLEDLWNFNEEVVARAIYRSTIPVISAVGHETDTTISDFVADLRAPTPSAAAELVCKDSSQLLDRLTDLQNRALRIVRNKWSEYSSLPHLTSRMEANITHKLQMRFSQLQEYRNSYNFQLPIRKLNESRQQLDDFSELLIRGLNNSVDNRKWDLKQRLGQLSALNPKSILKRGYSITFDAQGNHVIRSADEVKDGQSLMLVLGQGKLSVVAGAKSKAPSKRGVRKASSVANIDWFGLTQDEA